MWNFGSATCRLAGLGELPRLLRLGQEQVGASLPDGLLHDLAELLERLDQEEISPFALGMHSRRVVEQLVQHIVADPAQPSLPLFVGINLLRQRGVDPWLISCLHQICSFCNWMVHSQGPGLSANNEVGRRPRGLTRDTGQRRRVELADVLAVLASLQRVLAHYPWEQES